MVRIKASCNSCGKVELRPGEVLLRMRAPAGEQGNTYGFTCLGCGRFIEKQASGLAIALLLQGGVSPCDLDIPPEALEQHRGAPFTADDLIDFHQLLSQGDDPVRLLLGREG